VNTVSVTFGSRGSALARWQTDWAITQLKKAWPDLDCRSKTFTTAGDRTLDKPLPEIGGKGLFIAELENALRSGEIDIAVHSLKDLPVENAIGLTLGAIGEREDAHDVLIARDDWTLATLPHGARLGTCSLRRTAQALAIRPDLITLPLRGNVDTRLRKALNGDYDAIVLAAAGVSRLGLGEHISEYLPFDIMLPAPGQAALAVQCRADDLASRALLSALDHAPTRAAVTAERAFLQSLGSGCSAPVAAYAVFSPSPDGGEGWGRLTTLIASLDGQRLIRVSGEGSNPMTLGAQLAQQALVQGAEGLLQ